VQRRRRGIVEQLAIGRKPRTRIDHHAHRIRPRHVAHGQLGVVGGDRTGADDYGIHERAQPMQMDAAGLTRHVMGMPAFGGDPPIQTLPELRDYEVRPTECDRQQCIQQCRDRDRQFAVELPTVAFIDYDRCALHIHIAECRRRDAP
jgi:hypothetical protein